MSAHLHFQLSDAEKVSDFAVRWPGETDGEVLISFEGCPLGGVLSEETVQIPFPRNAGIRETLINWLLYWGIPFCVLP
ncbi:hypothetical protein [Burkholderia gladioli]|uniref:hypothetical protein n=1 Tax=Burkholderia gladioli TaxID=28095 RepID=UPI001641396D|nr:hypothetical protein [Burkholderia gladioli]